MHHLLSLEEIQINFNPFILETGKIVKGPLAAFLHHCQILNKGFGYHLFISNSTTDRELELFANY